MLKISTIGPGLNPVILRVEGHGVGPWVTEFGRCCDAVLLQGKRLSLQLADLEFLDPSGVDLLRSLRERGVGLESCSPFIEEQLKAGH